METGAFSIKIKDVISAAGALRDLSADFDTANTTISLARTGLPVSNGMDQVSKVIGGIIDTCGNHKHNMILLADKLEQIAGLYEQTEKGIVNNQVNTTVDKSNEPIPIIFDKIKPGVLYDPIWDIENFEPFDDEYIDYISQEQEQNLEEEINKIVETLPEEEKKGIGDYLLEAGKQIILGNFAEEGNLLGVIGNVLVGFTPVGLIADGRDIIADIVKIKEDASDMESWLMLGLDLVGVIPGFDVLKHADELGPLFKGLAKGADEISDGIKAIGKYGDDLVSGAKKIISEAAPKLDEVATGIKNTVKHWDEVASGKVVEGVKDVAEKIGDIGSNVWNKVDDGLSAATRKISDVGSDIWNKATGAADEFWDSVKAKSAVIDDISSNVTSLAGKAEEAMKEQIKRIQNFAAQDDVKKYIAERLHKADEFSFSKAKEETIKNIVQIKNEIAEVGGDLLEGQIQSVEDFGDRIKKSWTDFWGEDLMAAIM